MDADESLREPLSEYLGFDLTQDAEIQEKLASLNGLFERYGLSQARIQDKIVSGLVRAAERICRGVITYQRKNYDARDRRLDKLLTNRFTGLPVMILLLGLIFWLTITGANYPSSGFQPGYFGSAIE